MTYWRSKKDGDGGRWFWAILLGTLTALLILFTLSAISRAQSAELPFYCKALTHFERSCTGVKAAAHVLGKQRARWLALHCGATDAEIAEADACFIQITPTEK